MIDREQRPLLMAGQRIGLLGGSFDPPHDGHLHISLWARRALRLDQVWWIVSPGNPLKINGPADMDRRMDACRKLAGGAGIHVSDIERDLGSAFTAHTLGHLLQHSRGARFIWLMGADNLAEFHHWQDWNWIIETVPIAVFARPGQQVKAGLSPAARMYSDRRLPPGAAHRLGCGPRARWTLLPGPMSDLSSTQIRRAGDW